MRDLIIIGAGPVGATFALLAQQRGLKVVLLEARDSPSRETRNLALSHGSREILEEAGAWSAALNATEIHHIHTSQRGGFGRTHISRDDGSVPALGYVTVYADLQAALDTALTNRQLPLTRGAIVTAMDSSAETATVHYQHAGAAHSVTARAVILADGGANLDKVPAIQTHEKDYRQTALLGHIISDTPHHHTAWERFTPEGPAALLPHGPGGEYSLVWVSDPDRIAELSALDEAAFCKAFQTHFGQRAGRFLSVGSRRSFPLKLRTVETPVAGRAVVIGNAAQALHPVAGQGFNLGLRDAATLTDCASQDLAGGLATYATLRRRDVRASVGFTDFLVDAFSNDHRLLRIPRGLGLLAVDVLPFARRALARRMLFGALR
ncbi:MAG: FAD-dependent monooxygenase [Betaproteobacteria bacterium]|nr:FAD-dependent monooxygenase [Betaproteobacteria bacterium]